jgi:hypothetical protein
MEKFRIGDGEVQPHGEHEAKDNRQRVSREINCSPLNCSCSPLFMLSKEKSVERAPWAQSDASVYELEQTLE